jgi:hypothetical protein
MIVQKIKRNLIRKAKLNKDLSRARANVEPSTTALYEDKEEEEGEDKEPASMEPHPDRQAMINGSSEPSEYTMRPQRERRPRPKTQTFQKEVEDAEQKRKEREEREASRLKKMRDRQRLQNAVARSRKPGKDGKRRLGREGTVLLEKIKRSMGT